MSSVFLFTDLRFYLPYTAKGLIIDWPFSVQLPNSFPVPSRPARQHGACGFLSIPVSWLTCVTQHRIHSPFLVSPSHISLGNRGLGLHENAKHRFSPLQNNCRSDMSNILCIYNERFNNPYAALRSLGYCCMHCIALLVTRLLSCCDGMLIPLRDDKPVKLHRFCPLQARQGFHSPVFSS